MRRESEEAESLLEEALVDEALTDVLDSAAKAQVAPPAARAAPKRKDHNFIISPVSYPQMIRRFRNRVGGNLKPKTAGDVILTVSASCQSIQGAVGIWSGLRVGDGFRLVGIVKCR